MASRCRPGQVAPPWLPAPCCWVFKWLRVYKLQTAYPNQHVQPPPI